MDNLKPKTKERVEKAVTEVLANKDKTKKVSDNGPKVKIEVPILNPKSVDVFLKEVKVWDKLTRGYSDEDKALMLWSKVPTENAQGIKEKIDPDNLTVETFKEEITTTTLNRESFTEGFASTVVSTYSTQSNSSNISLNSSCKIVNLRN